MLINIPVGNHEFFKISHFLNNELDMQLSHTKLNASNWMVLKLM